jgi:hypothetical protein
MNTRHLLAAHGLRAHRCHSTINGGTHMNWDPIKGDWKQIAGKASDSWFEKK